MDEQVYPRHKDFVSIWVGDIRNEIGMDLYMHDFERDFGFDTNMGNPENWPVMDTTSFKMPIREKLSETLGAEEWIDDAVKSLESMQIFEASTSLILYNTKYDPDRYGMNASAPLKFIGSFPGLLPVEE